MRIRGHEVDEVFLFLFVAGLLLAWIGMPYAGTFSLVSLLMLLCHLGWQVMVRSLRDFLNKWLGS